MLSDNEIAAIEALKVGNEDNPMAKFCVDPRPWYLLARAIAVDLGLARCKALRIVDLGCGFGYFVRACSDMGHDTMGLDLPDPPMIERANEILGNRFISGRLRSIFKIPIDIQNVDIFTMFGVNLRHRDGSYWKAQQYSYLTSDVCDRLKPGGRFIIRPNLPYKWDITEWKKRIADFAKVDITTKTITVRPK